MARQPIQHVNNLESALNAYWNSGSHREDQAAYHEILLFGGPDGYPSHGKLRTAVIRWLRQAALWLERE
jgi:hypothetical protein